MIRAALFASVLLLGACATVAYAPPTQAPVTPSAGLTPAQVSQGFMEAVVEGCAAAMEAGKPISETAVIVRDDARPASFKRPNTTAWAPVSAKGIVAIDEGQPACEVSAYGAPVELTFDMTGKALAAKEYTALPSPPLGPRISYVSFSKQAGDRSIVVALSGNEPGAPGTMSRFSTLTATVSAKR